MNREDTINLGKDDVLKAIEEYISLHRTDSELYWNKDEYKEMAEKDFERFGTIYFELKGRGIDKKIIGKYLYYIGDEMKLPGFTPQELK